MNSSNSFYCFLFKVMILQSRVLDLVLHQPSYSKHPGALLINLLGISLHTDSCVNSHVGFFFQWHGFVHPFIQNVVRLSQFPQALGYPKQPRMTWTSLCIRPRLRLLSVSVKETEDGIRTVRVHTCVGRHCIKRGVISFLTESVSVLLTSKNCC